MWTQGNGRITMNFSPPAWSLRTSGAMSSAIFLGITMVQALFPPPDRARLRQPAHPSGLREGLQSNEDKDRAEADKNCLNWIAASAAPCTASVSVVKAVAPGGSRAFDRSARCY